MNRFHEFLPGMSMPDVPPVFPSPFAAVPHPLARRAALDLQQRLRRNYPGLETGEGKMFGVLVVITRAHRVGYLAGFSGMVDGQWVLPGFVPPIFSVAVRSTFLDPGEQALKALTRRIRELRNAPELATLMQQREQIRATADAEIAQCRMQHQERRQWRHRQRKAVVMLENAAEREAQLVVLARQSQQDKQRKKQLKQHWDRQLADVDAKLDARHQEIMTLEQERKALSNALQQQVFDGYLLTNLRGETRPLRMFYPEGLVPGGAGDCAGPKLIHYAISQGMKPLAMAEFWWGKSPSAGVRHHRQFYPACRGKCRPILPFMLRGVELEPEPGPFLLAPDASLDVIYQDDDLLLINKPAGLLSTPGKEVEDAVQTRLRKLFPDATGPLLVHRLDLATSGLLLVALRPEIHKALQQQFMQRRVEKRYVAILDGVPQGAEGVIDLPLRVDLDDRPRQVICRQYGKKAVTNWRVVSRERGRVRVHFFPETGRTHQLRVHAAHAEGLNAPIVGDELYGRAAATRMMLHAERLGFMHPVSREWRVFTVAAPF